MALPAWADVVSAYEASCRSLPSGTEGEVSSGEEDNGLDSDDDEVRSPLVKTISSTGHLCRFCLGPFLNETRPSPVSLTPLMD